MENKNEEVNLKYFISVSVLTFLLPVLCTFLEYLIKYSTITFSLYGKWFIFSAVGLRLTLAGIKQISDPSFTAKSIFKLKTEESYPILRELGFANLCAGLIGLISLLLPDWRMVSAFGSGLYMGIAGVQHFLMKSPGKNERFAMITDIFIAVILLLYLVKMIKV